VTPRTQQNWRRSVAMALLGTIDPFTSTDADDWSSYLARLEQYFKANKINDDRKKAVFLTVMGETTFRLLQTLIAPATVDDKTLPQLRDVLTKHFTPKRLIIAERFKFWKRNQQASESFSEYAAELRRLARTIVSSAVFVTLPCVKSCLP